MFILVIVDAEPVLNIWLIKLLKLMLIQIVHQFIDLMLLAFDR